MSSTITLGLADYQLYEEAMKFAKTDGSFCIRLNDARRLVELGVARREEGKFYLCTDVTVQEYECKARDLHIVVHDDDDENNDKAHKEKGAMEKPGTMPEMSDDEIKEILSELSARKLALLIFCIDNCHPTFRRIRMRAVRRQFTESDLDALFVALGLAWTKSNYVLPRWLMDKHKVLALCRPFEEGRE